MILLVVLMGGVQPVLGEERIALYAGPSLIYPEVGVLQPDQPFEVLQVEDWWTQVRQGRQKAWIPTQQLSAKLRLDGTNLEQPASSPAFHLNLRTPVPSPPGGTQNRGLVGDLLHFVADHQEMSAKMSDPFFWHRVTQISEQWELLFYRKTPYYYLQGAYLGRFSDRFYLSLVNRRMKYREIFGHLWSPEFMDAVIRSNRGILGNRLIFGNGNEFYLEIGLHF